MQWLYSKLKYFDKDDSTFLYYTVTKEKVDALETSEEQSIKFLFSRINDSTTDVSLRAIIDCVSQAFIYDETLSVFRVNEGEDFGLLVKKDNTNDAYTPFVLVARENESGSILTQQLAVDTDSQTLDFEDLDLTAGQTYKIRIQLEEDDGTGVTNGDATSQLTTVFFVVLNDIDSE